MPRNRRPAKTAKEQSGLARFNQPWLWIVLGVVLIAAVGFVIFRSAPAGSAVEISIAQAYEKYQQGAFFLDVRTQSEWDQMHLAQSTLIPLDQLSSRLGEVPKDKDVVVICRSGARSKEGMTILRSAGYTRVACMTGGLLAWKVAGYPLEGGQ